MQFANDLSSVLYFFLFLVLSTITSDDIVIIIVVAILILIIITITDLGVLMTTPAPILLSYIPRKC